MKSEVMVGGDASGTALVLSEPVSFWGGVEPATGVIVDRRHPQAGTSITGRILVLPAGRGSSSSSAVIAEVIRSGHGPAAIVLRMPDPIIALGAHMAGDLYAAVCPVVVTKAEIPDGSVVTIAGGEVFV